MKRVALLLGFVCATACVSVPRPEAELLLTGGRVYTGDAARPWAEAVAIREGRILAVGSQADMQLHTGPATKTIDLAGRLVIPGINDAHVHAPWLAEGGKWVPPPRENVSKGSFLAALRKGVTGTPDGVTVRSELPLTLVDAGITRADLDAISTAVPIRVGVFGGHSAILNTPALRAWRIDENAADPAGGWYGRDGARLNGWLYEHAYWLPQRDRTLAASDETLRAAIGAFENEALSYGITSVQTMSMVPPARLEALLAAMPARLRWRLIDFRLAPYDGSRSRFPVKYILDGTPIERSAAMIEPYADRQDSRGQVNYSEREIEAMVRDAAKGERQLLVHAVGDRTIAMLFDAMERTRADWPARRVRLEHGDLTTRALAARARKLGVVNVQNPAHFTIPEVMIPRLGPARSAESMLARSLIAEGNRFAIGSDGPLNPYLNMFFAAIHPVNPAEGLTVEQSLGAYTRGAAFAEYEEARKGVLRPGMVADLAVLSQDIFAVSPDTLPKTTSVLTIIGGKVAYEASEFSVKPAQ